MSLYTGITPRWGYGVHPKVILHSKKGLQDFSLHEELCAGLTTKYAVRRTEDGVTGPQFSGKIPTTEVPLVGRSPFFVHDLHPQHVGSRMYATLHLFWAKRPQSLASESFNWPHGRLVFFENVPKCLIQASACDIHTTDGSQQYSISFNCWTGN